MNKRSFCFFIAAIVVCTSILSPLSYASDVQEYEEALESVSSLQEPNDSSDIEGAVEFSDDNLTVHAATDDEAEIIIDDDVEEILYDRNADAAASIIVQPVDLILSLGETAYFTVEAESADTFQWQINRGTKWADLTETSIWHGVNTSTLSFVVSEARAGYKYRVIASNDAGQIISDEVGISLVQTPIFTKQPESLTACNGDTVVFEVEASGAESYQWQINRGKKWADLSETSIWHGVKTNALSFVVSEARAGYQYRVIASNDAGQAISDEVGIELDVTPVFTKQPESVTACNGDTVVFEAEASGAESYQWQINRGKKWADLSETSIWHGVNTSALSFVVSEARAGYKYRVIASNDAGQAISDEAGIALDVTPVFIRQPEDIVAHNGDNITFEAEASGADSYQWQINRGSSWANLSETSIWKGVKTGQLNFKVSTARAGYKYRVIASNDAGQTISAEVGITLDLTPVFTKQPESVTVLSGEQVVFSAEVSGADSYQWQINRGSSWANLSETSIWKGVNTDQLSFLVSIARAGYSYRLIVSNEAGQVISDVVTVELDTAFIVDDVKYRPIDDATAILVKYLGASDSVVIPEVVKGYTIVEVGRSAFEDNTELVSIDLPDTIQAIGECAFKNCQNLANML